MTEKYANPGKTGPPNLVTVCEEIRNEWLARVRSEAELATKLTEKITAAHSIPDAMAAYSEWVSGEMQLLADNNRRLWVDAQKVFDASMVASRVPAFGS